MLRRVSLSLVALFFAIPAGATGWDWDHDPVWTPPVVDWAMAVSNDPELSERDLIESISAPVHEPWCETNEVPYPADCDAYFDRVDWWLVDFQGLDHPGQIAPGTPHVPPTPGCPQSCSNF